MGGAPLTAQHRRATEVEIALNVDTLPATLESRGSKVLGALAMFFGAVFPVLLVAAIVKGVLEELEAGRAPLAGEVTGEMVAAMVQFVFLLGVFVPLFVYGYGEWVRRTVITIDRHEVRYEWRTWRGTARRVELLMRFSGISQRTQSDSDTGDTYELVLEHREAALHVVVYRADHWEGRAERLQRYCQVLGVPSLAQP
jgi:hypothetical protein